MNRLLSGLFILGVIACTSAGAQSPGVAFVGVNVVPMNSERVLADQTVVVRDRKIVALGPRSAVALPHGITRIDSRGRYLVPGLADMHAHLAGPASYAQSNKDTVTRTELLLYVATGVTLVRNMSGSPALLEYRRQILADTLLGPRIFSATNVVDGANQVWPFAFRMDRPDQAEPFVAAAVRDGYDQIKVYHELSREVYAALFDAAEKHKIKVVGHVPFSVGIDGALASGQYSIEHQRGYDFDAVRPQAFAINHGLNAERLSSLQRMSDERMRDLVRKTVAAGVWNCPTFVINDLLERPEHRAAVARHPLLRYVPAEVRAAVAGNDVDDLFPRDAIAAQRASLPQRYKLLKMLSDAGAGLLIGTDTPVPYLVPGFTPIDEMQRFVDAGLSPYQALSAATSGPARFLGIDSESGTIAIGKRADLLLVDANPLEDIAHLWRQSGVMVNGRWLPKSEIHRLLDALITK